ncbi:hypothetical protein Pfo_008982 [Paulownia fortunei]|nr:hypothetical protein Pfo_008982 [Paulownia fortunei]
MVDHSRVPSEIDSGVHMAGGLGSHNPSEECRRRTLATRPRVSFKPDHLPSHNYEITRVSSFFFFCTSLQNFKED